MILPWPRWYLNYFSKPGTSCLQVVFQVFPLHHTPSLESLQKSWVRKLFGLQPLGENIKSLKAPSKSLCAGEISEYFGLKIAFYFAWLGHYTTALSIPAIVGGAFWVGVAFSFKDTFCSLIVSSFSFTDALSSLKTSASSSFPFSMSRGQHSIWRYSYNQTLTYVVPAYVDMTSKKTIDLIFHLYWSRISLTKCPRSSSPIFVAQHLALITLHLHLPESGMETTVGRAFT